MPTAYGVCRISIDRDDSVSIEAQQACISNYHALKFGTASPAVPLRWLVDRGVSGAVPLLSRPGASELRELQRGDQVIVAKLDRGFRSVADASTTIDHLDQLGVGLHAVDLSIDTTTPVGRLIVHVMSAFAELERERIAERIRDANRTRRESGRPWAAHPPIGWTYSRDERGQRVFAIAQQERRDALRLVRWNDRGYGYHRLLAIAQQRGWTHRGRPLTRVTLRRIIRAARDGFPTVSEECRRYGSASPQGADTATRRRKRRREKRRLKTD